ncbi:MAG: MarR family transcriptional regulator, partial [Pseudomonas sp.]
RVLEAEGLVALTEGRDLRNRLVLLTELGQTRLREAEPAWEQAQTSLVTTLGEGQRDELVRLLELLA